MARCTCNSYVETMTVSAVHKCSEQDCVLCVVELAKVLMKDEIIVNENFNGNAENLARLCVAFALTTKLFRKSGRWMSKVDSISKTA